MAAQEEEVRETLRSLIDALRQGLGENLMALVLFGSRARKEGGEGSDWDIFLLAKSLPAPLLKRYAVLRRLCLAGFERGVSLLAKTQKEFEGGFPSFYLDLTVDGIILYDPDGYMQQRLDRIREIIGAAGLRRERIRGGFFWDWQQYPGAEWEITWKGFKSHA